MDYLGGFDENAVKQGAQKLYQLSALGLALTEAQLRARGNNCQSWFFKAVCQRLVAQIGIVEDELKGIVAQQEILTAGRDTSDEPLFVEDRR
jgi:hypothetical protein